MSLKESEAFEIAVRKTIDLEGPESSVKGDDGGVTKFGISQKFLEELTGGPVSAGFVLGLNSLEAKEIYRAHFWYKPKIHKIAHDKLREIVFDQGVNRSPFSAIASLQRALVKLSPVPVKVDGLLGPLTLDAIVATEDREALVREYVLDSQLSYVRIVEAKPHHIKFLRGWLTRAWGYLKED